MHGLLLSMVLHHSHFNLSVGSKQRVPKLRLSCVQTERAVSSSAAEVVSFGTASTLTSSQQYVSLHEGNPQEMQVLNDA